MIVQLVVKPMDRFTALTLNTDHDVTDGVEHCLANCTLLWVEQLAGLVLQPPEAGAEVGEAVLGLQVAEQLLHLRGPHTAPGVAAAQRAVARAGISDIL